MKVTLIYAYWPNQPAGITWCDLPWALRDKGLPKRLKDAGHEVLESMLVADEPYPEEMLSGLQLAASIGEEVARAVSENELPVILCGSCALAAVGAVAGLGGDDLGIAWFDAHPDLNTPDTSTSGIFEGMALAAATGIAWPAMIREHVGLKQPASLERSALFGAREIDSGEQRLIDKQQIPVCRNAEAINERLTGSARVYVHLDMDVHDALALRTNAFAVPGGPSADVVRETLTGLNKVSCLAMTGLDPLAQDAGKAADIAIEHVVALAAR